jgi:hypothetical protein
MTEETDFETYLYLSRDEFKIFLFDKKNIKNLFQETVTIENNFNFMEFAKVTEFLDRNIFKIEKLIGTFIKNIFLIVDNKDNFIIKLSNKNKIENKISKESIKSTLIKLKNLINENYKNQTIIHMLIKNQLVYDNIETLSSMNEDTNSQYL